MGCDIHMYVEQKVNGQWQMVQEKSLDSLPEQQDTDNVNIDDENDATNKKLVPESSLSSKFGNGNKWFIFRNYSLFGILAGVRSNVFLPFIEPRGLPEDISAEVKAEYYPGNNHTAHYLTLVELIQHENTIEKVPCFLNITQFKDYKNNGFKIKNYYKYTSYYKGADLVSNDKMERVLNLASFMDEYKYMTEITADVTYPEISNRFWVEILGKMKKLAETAEDVRCVFFFDN